jgi:hypothetical protein
LNISEFEIYKANVLSVHYLPKVFDNSSLFSICQNALYSGESRFYFFTSEQFVHISKDALDSLVDFTIILYDCEIKLTRDLLL